MSLMSRIKRFIHNITGDTPEPDQSHAPGERPEETPSGASSELMSIIPLIGGTALISATLVILLLRFTTAAVPRIVTFDVVKYVNAERAIADKMFGKNDPAAVAPSLLEISKKTRAVIREVAGPHTLVVIQQAIVQGQADDITNQVLERLGLPTNVPTSSPVNYALNFAPTEIGHPVFLTPKGQVSTSPLNTNQQGLP